MDTERLVQILRGIYDHVRELQAMCPGRHFTPDGHMVGSIGEVLAAHYYGIELYSASNGVHDGRCGSLQVQVKTTQRNRVALTSKPEHLLVLKLSPNGAFEEIYNGPGHLVWAQVSGKPRPKNGQYQVGITLLRALMERVPEADVLRQVRS